ncbi:hypothetical protein ZHAS_00017152 [Anopheles sinensis]|uniref:Uncharacterized protein n=1 Tax=Anopheles sinensis TaxID=74873 RepID=A0A084WF95_ANOSI|nr:hypothetical protein ZHAS_00017152 [Anopheles sinensis]
MLGFRVVFSHSSSSGSFPSEGKTPESPGGGGGCGKQRKCISRGDVARDRTYCFTDSSVITADSSSALTVTRERIIGIEQHMPPGSPDT